MLPHHKDRKTAAAQHAHKFAAPAIALGLLMLPGSDAVAADRGGQNPSLRPLCGLWDGQASAAIVRTASKGRDKIDLQRLSDDLSRMRRARRSCDLGLIQAACQDYIAIMRGVGGTSLEWRGATLVCPAAMTAEPVSDVRQADAQPE